MPFAYAEIALIPRHRQVENVGFTQKNTKLIYYLGHQNFIPHKKTYRISLIPS